MRVRCMCAAWHDEQLLNSQVVHRRKPQRAHAVCHVLLTQQQLQLAMRYPAAKQPHIAVACRFVTATQQRAPPSQLKRKFASHPSSPCHNVQVVNTTPPPPSLTCRCSLHRTGIISGQHTRTGTHTHTAVDRGHMQSIIQVCSFVLVLFCSGWVLESKTGAISGPPLTSATSVTLNNEVTRFRRGQPAPVPRNQHLNFTLICSFTVFYEAKVPSCENWHVNEDFDSNLLCSCPALLASCCFTTTLVRA